MTIRLQSPDAWRAALEAARARTRTKVEAAGLSDEDIDQLCDTLREEIYQEEVKRNAAT